MKTHTCIINKMMKAVGRGITHHEPTPENPLGQSGLHTIVDDIQDIFEAHKNDHPSVMNRALHNFFLSAEEGMPKKDKH